MLKITDKPKCEDFKNTMEVMDMFKHAIHSDFALEWMSGALATIDVERTNKKAYRKAIEIWFSDDAEAFEEFTKLFKRIVTLITLMEMHDELSEGSESDEL